MRGGEGVLAVIRILACARGVKLDARFITLYRPALVVALFVRGTCEVSLE